MFLQRLYLPIATVVMLLVTASACAMPSMNGLDVAVPASHHTQQHQAATADMHHDHDADEHGKPGIIYCLHNCCAGVTVPSSLNAALLVMGFAPPISKHYVEPFFLFHYPDRLDRPPSKASF